MVGHHHQDTQPGLKVDPVAQFCYSRSASVHAPSTVHPASAIQAGGNDVTRVRLVLILRWGNTGKAKWQLVHLVSRVCSRSDVWLSRSSQNASFAFILVPRSKIVSRGKGRTRTPRPIDPFGRGSETFPLQSASRHNASLRRPHGSLCLLPVRDG